MPKQNDAPRWNWIIQYNFIMSSVWNVSNFMLLSNVCCIISQLSTPRYVLRTYLYGSPCSWENLGMFYVRINMPESLSLALDYLLLFLCTFNSKYFWEDFQEDWWHVELSGDMSSRLGHCIEQKCLNRCPWTATRLPRPHRLDSTRWIPQHLVNGHYSL